MSDYPICSCAAYYGTHHPECPVVAEIERLQEEVGKARADEQSSTEALVSAQDEIEELKTVIHEYWSQRSDEAYAELMRKAREIDAERRAAEKREIEL